MGNSHLWSVIGQTPPLARVEAMTLSDSQVISREQVCREKKDGKVRCALV